MYEVFSRSNHWQIHVKPSCHSKLKKDQEMLHHMTSDLIVDSNVCPQPVWKPSLLGYQLKPL